ncbi:phospho-N-acetylmuramoyl-pentapeptide-transferase [Anaerostipes sp. MSJ-23]|uniref:phospho-N-acetylmuramoyl-pentapeptide- transferase n=1 Tax=unclassified Anaerostipes TaxID=2635253 RepID=UPI001C1127CD|nr:phospho-N-acetylmuramoyl-pentapeptide-transferase [Anaerostipes sp. MSJ-23]MBU5458838.1 phospho-N-acetylmuramoyl-pentapeptide-transferase [Anaerostipes sp. MSJ-23]
MIYLITGETFPVMAFLGVIVAFALTCTLTSGLNQFLPRDMGRAFAHDGKLSAGKPRGAGIIFIASFTVAALIFGQMSLEIFIYLVLVFIEMITGYMDDAADEPWGEYKKGILDFLVAAVVALNFIHFNSTKVSLATIGVHFEIPKVLFFILTIILVWAAINVTNCSDGVDGLSGTLTIITLVTIYVIDQLKKADMDFAYIILLFVVCILGYLWYNAAPSKLMMGDAGSRAMGIFISIAVLKTGSPFLFLLVAAVLIVDGGLGLVKVSLLRFLKIHIFKNTTMPLHDHVRKNEKFKWSNTQTVFRFAIIQIVISIATIYLILI